MLLSRIFTLVGIGFGAAFVFINAGGLPGAWPWVARILGIVLLATAFWFGAIRQQPEAMVASDQSIRVYWTAVVAELLAIPLGALVISKVLDRSELTVLWVVFVVGAHFLPARAFGSGRWTELGLVLIGLAILGCIGVFTLGESSASAAAVLAGAALLIFAALPGFVSVRVQDDWS